MTDRWYVIQTRVAAEARALAGLRREGIETFAPKVMVPHQREFEEKSLFPGYIFINGQPRNWAWEKLKSVPGVVGVVRYGGEIPWLSVEEKQQLERRVEQINSGGGLWRRFRKGDQVIVRWGKVDSTAEIVEEIDKPNGRVRVLLDMLGGRAHAQVPWSSLTPDVGERKPRRTRGRGRWINGQGPRSAALA